MRNMFYYFVGPETPENLYFDHVAAVTVNLTHVALIGAINLDYTDDINNYINIYVKMKYHVVLYDFEINKWTFLANLPLENVKLTGYVTCPLSSVIYFDKFANK